MEELKAAVEALPAPDPDNLGLTKEVVAKEFGRAAEAAVPAIVAQATASKKLTDKLAETLTTGPVPCTKHGHRGKSGLARPSCLADQTSMGSLVFQDDSESTALLRTEQAVPRIPRQVRRAIVELAVPKAQLKEAVMSAVENVTAGLLKHLEEVVVLEFKRQATSARSDRQVLRISLRRSQPR